MGEDISTMIKRKYVLIHLLFAAMWLLSVVLSVSFEVYIAAVLGVPFIIASFVVAFVFCRCPFCGSRATIRFLTLNPDKKNFCPRCGNKIEIGE